MDNLQNDQAKIYIQDKRELFIPVHATVHSSLDSSADLNLCKSTCAISSIRYIMRNPHITSTSANGTL